MTVAVGRNKEGAMTVAVGRNKEGAMTVAVGRNKEGAMTMGLWIQYYTRKLDGQLGEALGSDGLHRLDGRLGLRSAVQEGYSRAYNLRHVQPDYEAFAIMRGDSPRHLTPQTQAIQLK